MEGNEKNRLTVVRLIAALDSDGHDMYGEGDLIRQGRISGKRSVAERGTSEAYQGQYSAGNRFEKDI